MLIVTAVNVTGDGRLAREDGTADYDVWIGINHHHCIWRGPVKNFVRDRNAAELLREIANAMDATACDCGCLNRPHAAHTEPCVCQKTEGNAKDNGARSHRRKRNVSDATVARRS